MNISKKFMIFLMAMNCVSVSPLKAENSINSTGIIAGVAAGIACAGTIGYLTRRESNSSKIERVHKLVENNYPFVHDLLKNLEIEQGVLQIIKDGNKNKAIISNLFATTNELRNSLHARNSWIKPWNWSNDLTEAVKKIDSFYNKVFIINSVMRYARCIASNYDQKEVIQYARVAYAGDYAYPLVSMLNRLNSTIATIQSMNICESYSYVCLNILQSIKESLITSDEYNQEHKQYEIHKQQERMARAAEEQARAQEARNYAEYAKAQAERDKARAMEERNRIEKAKLAEEKRKNRDQ